MRRLLMACVSILGVSLVLACGSDDDEGASGSGGSGGGTGGTSGIGGTGGTGATGGTGGTGGTSTGGTGATGGTGGSAGEAGSGASAGEAGSAGSGGSNTVPLTVTIYDLVQQDPIADMDVCLHEAQPENCTTTDDAGVATLQVPPNQDVVLTYGTTLPNFRTHALAIGADAITNGTNITTGALLESIASYLFANLSITDDPSKGHVVGLALATEGATATIEPFSGQGPIYTSPSGTPDPTLTATSDSGAFLFVNVDPGTVEVAVELTGGTCSHKLGHTGSAPNATPVPVHAGWFSIAASFECL